MTDRHPDHDPRRIRLLLHGGAGDLPNDAGDLQAQRQALGDIATNTLRALQDGADAVQAVESAVTSLEDCPLFNAGRGAVLNRDGVAELDAAIMDGRQQTCGAVAAVTRVRNPVRLARAVMERSGFAFFAGTGAEALAAELGLAMVEPSYFVTTERLRQLEVARRRGTVLLDHDAHDDHADAAFGTVGAVARDGRGHLAAATSTGGLTNKPSGRIGDTPVIGAGTWACDRTLAISCTGTGESFIRSGFAHAVDARLRLTGADLTGACREALAELPRFGGRGGCIAVDREGRLFAGFNSRSMFRAWIDAEGSVRVAVHADEPCP